MVTAGVNYGLDLAADIAELKRERNAVILAHNYQVREIQEVADFVGDSLGLSYQAAKTDAEVILFCGVHFMAETAKIINPTKCVVLPDLDAGCSLSESCPPPALAAFLKKNADKNYYVIAYINCSAGVKALSDVICTSGNAEKIVRAAPPDRNILFVPDQNLGAWVMEKTGRKMDLWRGTCYVHVEFTARSIRKIREQHPGAPLVAHPEISVPDSGNYECHVVLLLCCRAWRGRPVQDGRRQLGFLSTPIGPASISMTSPGRSQRSSSSPEPPVAVPEPSTSPGRRVWSWAA